MAAALGDCRVGESGIRRSSSRGWGGGPMFATVALATSVNSAVAFGMPSCMTARNNREASVSSCLHQASAAFVTAAIANPIT